LHTSGGFVAERRDVLHRERRPPKRDSWPQRSASFVGITGMGNVRVIDIGCVLGIGVVVVARALIGSLGLDCVRCVTGH
jgi:hypothetical protein